MDDSHIPTELPQIPPDPGEADIAEPGDGSAPPLQGYPRMDVARKRARQVAFLGHFRQCGVLSEAAKRAGVSRNLVYKYWRSDPLFEAAYQEAVEEAADVVEAEIYRRSVEGFQEVVVHQGMPTMLQDPATGEERPFTVTRYSDSLLQTLAKARRPEKFRDNHRVEHAGQVTTGVLVVPAAVDPEAWAAAAERQQARFRPDGKGDE